MKVCAEPGCPELVKQGRSYCAAHARQRERDRDPRIRAVYSSRRWKGARLTVIRRQPWCIVEGCLEPTSDVDHIIPVAELLETGGDPYDVDNLQGMCAFHHSAKTARETWDRRWARNA